MSETAALVRSAIAGGALGAFFFGGLWWTVARGRYVLWSAVVFLVSRVVRTSVVLVAFYVVSSGHASRMVAALLGFTVASVAARTLPRLSARHSRDAEGDLHHAP